MYERVLWEPKGSSLGLNILLTAPRPQPLFMQVALLQRVVQLIVILRINTQLNKTQKAMPPAGKTLVSNVCNNHSTWTIFSGMRQGIRFK